MPKIYKILNEDKMPMYEGYSFGAAISSFQECQNKFPEEKFERVSVETIFGTIEEHMNMALHEEELAIRSGSGDPYFNIAKRNIEYYLACAAALERGETEIETTF